MHVYDDAWIHSDLVDSIYMGRHTYGKRVGGASLCQVALDLVLGHQLRIRAPGEVEDAVSEAAADESEKSGYWQHRCI